MNPLEDAVSDIAQDAAQKVVLRHLAAAEDKSRPSQLRAIIRQIVQAEIAFRERPIQKPQVLPPRKTGVWKVTCCPPYPTPADPLTYSFNSYDEVLDHLRDNPSFDHKVEVPKL